jgi:uncharacterized protein (TIGR02996 family)
MTADERALLNAILATPEDDLPRLVYADWLEERDRPERAEFIRVQCELARSEPGSEGRARLFARQAELMKRHQPDWFPDFSAVASLVVSWKTARGFVESLEVGAEGFLSLTEASFADQPITHLKVPALYTGYGADRRWFAKQILTSPLLGRVASLDLDSSELNAAGAYWLSRNPHVRRLRELSVSCNRLNDEGAVTLARMPGLGQLRVLDLSGNYLTDPGAQAVISSPHFRHLEELRLAGNRFSEPMSRELLYRFGRALVG